MNLPWSLVTKQRRAVSKFTEFKMHRSLKIVFDSHGMVQSGLKTGPVSLITNEQMTYFHKYIYFLISSVNIINSELFY